MKFLKGILFLLLGLALSGTFFFIAWKYWDFFSDPNWSEWRSSGNSMYRSRVEGGNMWLLLLLFFPFAAGAFFSFKRVWELWIDSRIGEFFFGLCLSLFALAGTFFWVLSFPEVLDISDINILGVAGYVLIPGSILFWIFALSIFLLKGDDSRAHREEIAAQQLQLRQRQCRHDWFCGTCRICGKTEAHNEMYGHDVVCGKCTRCEKAVSAASQIGYDSHQFVDGKCTVCGFDVNNDIPTQKAFEEIAKNGITRNERMNAIRKLTDQSVLAEIATNETMKTGSEMEEAIAAGEMLEDRGILHDIAVTIRGSFGGVQTKAIEKLMDPAKVNCENHNFEPHSITTMTGRDTELTRSWEECTLCGLWRNLEEDIRFTDY